MRLKVFFFIGGVLGLSVMASNPADAADRRLNRSYVSARSAIFSNTTKGKRYYGKNIHVPVQPASTTKVMTALLVMERLTLDQEVTISREATLPQPSKIYAQTGERYKVGDLLYALLMNSANDASVALAEAVAGSEKEFVRQMNQRARQLGAKNTRFANSHGLPSGERQYTTAYDMFLIFRAALKHPVFDTVIRTKYKIIYSAQGRAIPLKSHNKILFNEWDKKVYGKTGYTKQARSCFVGYVPKGKDICIISVFGCSKRWTDIKNIVTRYGGISL